ncbi:LVIVD repeat-containing protein [Corallococcus terminator]
MHTRPSSQGSWRFLCVLLPLLVACGDSDSGKDAGSLPDSGTPDSGLPPEDAGTPDSGPPLEDAGTPDSGSPPWDGTYTVLEDQGDWIDRGRYDTCQFLDAENLDPQRCQSLSSFDLSSCSTEQLSALEGQGIFQLSTRTELRVRADRPTSTSVSNGSGAFQLSLDGSKDSMGNAPLLARVTEGGTFFVAGRRTNWTPMGDATTTTAFAGCHVPSPGVITGCYVSCFDSPFSGYSKTLGTFEAYRMTWVPGEGESSGGLSRVGEASTPIGLPVDIYVAKEHAYVVSLGRTPQVGGLSVFDVKDRTNPTLVKTISIAGDGAWNGVWAKGDALYIASDSSGLVVFDISDPANPVFVRRAEGPAQVHTVLVEGNRVYANSAGTGTYVYDITTPLEPTLLQLVTPTPGGFSGGPHDSFVYGDRLYISNADSGFSIMDITDLDNVQHLGNYTPPGSFVYAHHNAVGTFAGRTIAFEGGEGAGAHLRVLDVTDPTNIPLIGTFRMRAPASIHNLLLRGNLLYIAWYQEGLRVIDVSNPTQPRQVAHFNTFREDHPDQMPGSLEGAIGVRIPGDGYVYVVDSARGLIILDEL